LAEMEPADQVAPESSDQSYPLGVLPERVRQAPVEAREAYAFATDPENFKLMQILRCYCGCEAGRGLKHDNLFMCYVENLLPGDRIVYSSHALGCGTCLREASDASKWRAEGRSDQEIQELIDTKYDRSREMVPGEEAPTP